MTSTVSRLTQLHLDVYGALRSRRSPVSANALSITVGLSGTATRRKRELRRLVADLRASGYPILSGPEGYWLSDDTQEMRRRGMALIEHGRAEIEDGTALIDAASRRDGDAAYDGGIDPDLMDSIATLRRSLANSPIAMSFESERALREIQSVVMGR